MCAADSGKVTVVAFKSLKAVMDKPIVENEVNGSIGADAGAYPKAIVQIKVPYPHHP